MLPPTTMKLASLEPGEQQLHSAEIRLCGWEKNVWPFHGYTPSELYGGFPALAHWTSRRVIIEPEKISMFEKIFNHTMTRFLEYMNPIAGKMASRKLEAAEKFADGTHESGTFLSIPHTDIEKYQPLSIYVQIVLEESVNDAETLCFAAWELGSSTPCAGEIIELGNALVAKARR